MRFGFLNNFTAQLAAPVADDATEIELSTGAEAIATALENADVVALTLFATDSQGNETKREVVYATVATVPMVTIDRAEEGTMAAAFTAGDEVEARLTAAALSSASGDNRIGFTEYGTFYAVSNLVEDSHNPDPNDQGGGVVIGLGALTHLYGGVAIGTNAQAGYETVAVGSNASAVTNGNDEHDWSLAAGGYANANGYHSTAVGGYTQALGESSLAVGAYAESRGNNGVALGPNTLAQEGCIVMGTGAKITDQAPVSNAILIGKKSYAGIDNSVFITDADQKPGTSRNVVCIGMGAQGNSHGVVVGRNAKDFGFGEVVVGADATASPFGVAVGRNANASNDATALGHDSDAGMRCTVVGKNAKASEDGVAIGKDADASVLGGLVIEGLSYAKKSGLSSFSITNNAMQTVLVSGFLDVTDSSASQTISLPNSTMFFADAFDVVVLESDTPGGAPEIQIGPDDVSPAAYLAATPVTKTALGGRETHAPLVTDGITALRVSVVAAGSGTAYKIKVVVRGYVMEV